MTNDQMNAMTPGISFLKINKRLTAILAAGRASCQPAD